MLVNAGYEPSPKSMVALDMHVPQHAPGRAERPTLQQWQLADIYGRMRMSSSGVGNGYRFDDDDLRLWETPMDEDFGVQGL